MCSTDGAGNHHEVESHRASDVVPKMHGFVHFAKPHSHDFPATIEKHIYH